MGSHPGVAEGRAIKWRNEGEALVRASTLAFLLAMPLLVSSPSASTPVVAAVRPPRTQLQGGEPRASPAAGGQEGSPEAQPVLSAEDGESIELLRSVLADEGRESARELLHEIVTELAEPQAGEENARVAFLLDLDRVAKELGSLEELRRIRESLLALRSRFVDRDHPDHITAKWNLALTLYALGDLAGAKQLFEAVHEAWARLLPPDHPDLIKARGTSPSSGRHSATLRARKNSTKTCSRSGRASCQQITPIF